MRWSWRIGTFAGIGVYMHATFLLIIGWVALAAWLQARTLDVVLGSIAFILALFLCVVLHEYGHALTARRYGIATRDITLLPIGGVARLERMPEEPHQELKVALAGPAVNVVIAALLVVWLSATGTLSSGEPLSLVSGPFLERLLLVNVFLVGFNMIPAFPMDGGRVLRALLASRTDYVRATSIAASIGQGFALVFGFVGLFFNPFLLFIALFVWIGAGQEASVTAMRHSLAGIPVAHAMMSRFSTLAPGDSLTRAVDLILAGSQHDFPVVEDGRPVGVLTRDDLVVALQQRGPAAPVRDAMRRDFPVIDSYDMLQTASDRLQSCECHTMPVLHHGQLVGLVTMDNIGEFLMIQSALGRPAGGALPGKTRAA